MNTNELLELLNSERKSLDTNISLEDSSIHFHYPRAGWQRYARIEADRPVEVIRKTLEWVEGNARRFQN